MVKNIFLVLLLVGMTTVQGCVSVFDSGNVGTNHCEMSNFFSEVTTYIGTIDHAQSKETLTVTYYDASDMF